ncbi:MAG: UPF0223 family protein [Bacilli bacterium]|nr:UPF0223 family protein [Bacilli bacterium]MDD2681344.1 UPF0223 family protein [Bacilli bacterium]MDD3120853.1 UPF0223 family protein [Bacilli bacterium]MDD4063048.1 UPF0223 family protein [Bacilli bacterium]MDD4481672.1 UPF0223 family protein [Bacilli bacterium]
MVKDYEIDFDLFNTLEIVKIFTFFELIEATKKKSISKELLNKKYKEYKVIINNKTLEKKYDKMFQKITGISIYKTMRLYK